MRGLSLLLALSACASDDVVVATLLDARDAPDAQVAPGCRTQVDCTGASYCAKKSCDDAFGTCLARPTLCAPEPAPVCGCDGVTYFSDCVRQQSGVSLRHAGDCAADEAARCGGVDARMCPANSYCALLFAGDGECASPVEGRCWVIPACDDDGPRGGDRFVPCGRAPSDADCVDACTAITSEVPHRRVFRCRIDRDRERDDPSRI
ncbi:MAG: Kazal-type serine protease inhibitor [Polyangiales bacterium]